jgi:transcriptional regulator with XRE-family HTH domain
MNNYREIGQRIKYLRGKTPMKEFARQLAISFAAYQNYEYGKRLPPAQVLQKIAALTHVTSDYIMTGDEAFLHKAIDEGRVRIVELTGAVRTLDDEIKQTVERSGVPVPPDIGAFVNVALFYKTHGIDLAQCIAAAAAAEKSLQVAAKSALIGEDDQVDEVSRLILLLLKDMSDEDRRAILKNVEEKKLLHELMEERKKLKDAG